MTAGDGSLFLTWAAVNGATTYEVWYGTVNDSASAVKYGADVATASVEISRLPLGKTYYVWIKAKNGAGTSAFSPAATATLTQSGGSNANAVISFSVQRRTATDSMIPNEIVYVDVNAAEPRIERQDLTDGPQSLRVTKGGHYSIGFAYNPALASAARQSLLPRSISGSISLMAGIGMIANSLQSLPVAPGAADEVALGDLEQDTDSVDYVSAASEGSLTAQLGRTADELALVSKYDHALRKLLNPDIDRDGVYDQEEGLSWSARAIYYIRAKYGTSSTTDGSGPVEYALEDTVELRIYLSGEDYTQIRTWYLKLPEDYLYIDSTGMRVKEIVGYSGPPQYGPYEDPGCIIFHFPVCSGDFELSDSAGSSQYWFHDASFLDIDASREDLVFPVLKGSADSSGMLISGKLGWKRVIGGETVDMAPEEAYLVHDSQYTITMPNNVKGLPNLHIGDAERAFNPPYDPLDLSTMRARLKDGSNVEVALSVSTTSANAAFLLDETWTYADSYGVPGDPGAILPVGDTLFVAGKTIKVFDISGGREPEFLCDIVNNTSGSGFQSLAVSGGTLYASDGNLLHVFDVSNPRAICRIRKFGTDGTYSHGRLVANGGYLYIRNETAKTLMVYDISEPFAPLLVTTGTEALSPYPGSFYASDRLICQGTAIYDLSDPRAPHLLSSIDLGVFAYYVKWTSFDGRYLYASVHKDAENRIRIFDCMDPSNPSERASIENDGRPFCLSAAGILLTFPDASSGYGSVRAYDVGTPTNVSSLGSSTNAVAGLYAGAAVASDRLYMSMYQPASLEVFDLAGGIVPERILEFGTVDRKKIVLYGGTAVVSGQYGDAPVSVFTIGATGATRMADVAMPEGDRYRAGVFENKETLYIGTVDGYGQMTLSSYAAGTTGLRIMSSTEMGFSLYTIGAAGFQENTAYLFESGGTQGMIVDFPYPDAPMGIASWPNDGRTYTISGWACKDGYAYAACREHGLEIYNLADPYAPAQTCAFTDFSALGLDLTYSGGSIQTNSTDVLFIGHVLYVVNGGLVLFDVSDPASPRAFSYVLHHASRYQRYGQYLIGIGIEGALVVLNCSDPFNPRIVSQYGSGVAAFAIEGNSIVAVQTDGSLKGYSIR